MKIIKDKPDSSCMVIAGDSYTQITAGANSITTTREEGNFVNGPLSITSSVDHIRVGGIWKFNPLLATGLPSTIITPIPTLVFDIPLSNMGSAAAVAKALTGLGV